MTTSNYSGTTLRISVLHERLAVCRLEPDGEVPSWAAQSEFSSVTRTQKELSIVCPEQNVPEGVKCEEGWRALGIEGPLDFSLTGVLTSFAEPLAEAGISIFAVSTYDTDYVLVREDTLEKAISALRRAGHGIQRTNANVIVRPAKMEDESFLWEMLYEAVHWNSEGSGPKPPPEELLSEPGLRHYLEGWGKENDFAVVAMEDDQGKRIGAAWYRIFSAQDPGYGLVDEATPDIAMAVVPNRRGVGVGSALLQALMGTAYSSGFVALSLSVQKSNHAAMKLYEKKGFVKLRDDGDTWTMKTELPTAGMTNDAQSAP